ncbi:hypothetical protein MARA_18380 [Mycolicibacterium arabiense]|uniref:Uncharacterized protein n=1 Tax=Mycolicibacterium arabiense TaxID=1286181 RepID=A0A7I7RW09_9MYCO|nr:hypothetical protein [Mycolicibacterium arabiense]MCV7375225.1 hypothetical protein [Mycolicibacterium arabiense]BBY48370.1 hypothetical protein MARA_18380 [Mycolicibacterium arabiense]
MLDHLWNFAVQAVHEWDWPTIAAFVAVGVTLWVARSSTRAGRRQLRQSAVIDLNEQTVTWLTEVNMFLDNIAGYLDGRVDQSAIGPAASDRVSAATGRLDRSLKAAQMVIPDFEMAAALTAAEFKMYTFLQLLRNPAPTSIDDERRTLTRIVTEGRPLVREFEAGAGPLVLRGFKLYRLRRGVWCSVFAGGWPAVDPGAHNDAAAGVALVQQSVEHGGRRHAAAHLRAGSAYRRDQPQFGVNCIVVPHNLSLRSSARRLPRHIGVP